MQIIQGQCKRSSRKVKTEVESVNELAQKMVNLCHNPGLVGRHQKALAIAHCQVNHDDPMRFFVFNDGRVIINPKINSFSVDEHRYKEGCMSFQFRDEKIIKRSSRVIVSYKTLEDGELKDVIEEEVSGIEAKVFQHEIDHMNGRSIYCK